MLLFCKNLFSYDLFIWFVDLKLWFELYEGPIQATCFGFIWTEYRLNHGLRQFGIVVLIVVWFIRIDFQEGVRIESVWNMLLFVPKLSRFTFEKSYELSWFKKCCRLNLELTPDWDELKKNVGLDSYLFDLNIGVFRLC